MINAKLGWDDDSNTKQALLGTALTLGMTIGACSGGALMKIGRRRAVLIACFFGIIGVIITSFLTFETLIIGRLIYGFSAGLFSSMCPRFLDETIPTHLYDRFAPTYVLW